MSKNNLEPTSAYDLSILSVQVDYWDSPWQNRHAFLFEMADHCPVFFQSPPFYLYDLVKKQQRTALPSGVNKVKSGLFSYVPSRLLPYNYRFKKIDRIISRLREFFGKRYAKKLGFGNPVLFIWHPRFAREIGKHNERLVVYYKYDNYSGYSLGVDDGAAAEDPEEVYLLEKADLVLVTSEGLYDLHREAYQSKLHLIPNGVDYPYFSEIGMAKDYEFPDDLACIPGPRIGYIGLINEKVDFKLLREICVARPEWSIVLVGREQVRRQEYRQELEHLKAMPNVYFLGIKPGREIPYYIRGMDVCMMCYIVNEWTYFGYPLKMHEYLACGKPTIACDLPAISGEFSDVICIADTPEDWINGIDAFLSDDDDISRDRRMAVAKQNSWSERVKTALQLIKDKLDKKAVSRTGHSADCG